MNNLSMLLLSASGTAEAAQLSSDTWNTIIQYGIYAVIIVVCIVILVFLRKRDRLPKHGELKKKLTLLSTEIAELKTPEKKVKFLKNVSSTIYKADNLAYTAAMMAEKERYADLNRISSLIEEAHNELNAYKYGKKEPDDSEGFDAAADKVAEAIAVLDSVIERDGELRRGKK